VSRWDDHQRSGLTARFPGNSCARRSGVDKTRFPRAAVLRRSPSRCPQNAREARKATASTPRGVRCARREPGDRILQAAEQQRRRRRSRCRCRTQRVTSAPNGRVAESVDLRALPLDAYCSHSRRDDRFARRAATGIDGEHVIAIVALRSRRLGGLRERSPSKPIVPSRPSSLPSSSPTTVVAVC
jgi:hypothetical protein